MRCGVVVFPGSNCDRDAHDAVTQVLGQRAEYLWHKDTSAYLRGTWAPEAQDAPSL